MPPSRNDPVHVLLQQRHVRRALAGGVSLLLAVLWLNQPSSLLRPEPGPVLNPARAGTGALHPVAEPGVAALTVRYRQVSRGRALLLNVTGEDDALAPAATVGGDASAQMQQAQRSALHAAVSAAPSDLAAQLYRQLRADAFRLTRDLGPLSSGDLITALAPEGQPYRHVHALEQLQQAAEQGATSRIMRAGDAAPVELDAATLQQAQGHPDWTGQPPISAPLPGVGGPSAGLALAVTFLDALTPGSLLTNRPIAATGAVTPLGAVQPIAGLALKLQAAAQAGLPLVLVPATQTTHQQQGVELVGVADVAAAVRWLCANTADVHEAACRR